MTMVSNASIPRFFAVTTPGLSATRWLAYILASHPEVFVAHGKHSLDAVLRGNFTEAKETLDLDSLESGNAMRTLYEEQSLEEVFARYQQTRPGARVYGCVHSYTLDALLRAADSPRIFHHFRILNLVRHPVTFIASHYALVRSAEKHPPLYQHYLERVFPQVLQEVPELFLLPCPDYRAFLAFAVSCFGVANLIRDLCFPEVRSVKMEELTTRADLLQSVCEELTGLSYSQEALRPYLSRGAINQHRSPGSSKDPHALHASWEPWQQDMARVMIPQTVLDWLEELNYDTSMLRCQPSKPATAASPATPCQNGCLADHLRMLDQRHPYLTYLNRCGLSEIQSIETEQRGFSFVRQEGKVYALARTLDVQNPQQLAPSTLRQLQVQGLYFCTNSVVEAWVDIAWALRPQPEMVEQKYGEFNLVGYRGKVFAVSQRLGALDVSILTAAALERLCRKKKVYVANSVAEARQWINSNRRRLLVRRIMNAAKRIAGRAWRWRRPAPSSAC